MRMTVSELFEAGGVYRLEQEAAAQAIRETREFWLGVLEDWLAKDDSDPLDRDRFFVGLEIRRLRRVLGLRPSDDERRTQNRERVRRHRERRRQGIVLRHRWGRDSAPPAIAQ